MRNLAIAILSVAVAVTVLISRSLVYDSVDKPLPQHFNVQEKDGDRLTVHFHERRPFYARYKEKVYGLVANPINLTMEETDISFSWIETPASRQLDIIKSNKSKACAAGWFKTPEREKYAKFTLPLYQDKPFIAISRADNDLLDKEETVDRVFKEYRLSLLIKSGYSYGAYLDNKLSELTPRKVVTTADNLGMLKMILTHRADYCFMTEEEAHDLLVYSMLNKTNFKTVYFDDIPAGNKRYLICSKKVTDGEIDEINNAVKHIIIQAHSP